jgi:WD40 repeat protein
MLASGSWDTKIVLLDVESQQPIGQPIYGADFGGSVHSIAFSPNSKILASGTDNGAIILWNIDPLSWIEKSCQRAGRNITRAEWAKYFPSEEYRVICPQWPVDL